MCDVSFLYQREYTQNGGGGGTFWAAVNCGIFRVGLLLSDLLLFSQPKTATESSNYSFWYLAVLTINKYRNFMGRIFLGRNEMEILDIQKLYQKSAKYYCCSWFWIVLFPPSKHSQNCCIDCKNSPNSMHYIHCTGLTLLYIIVALLYDSLF